MHNLEFEFIVKSRLHFIINSALEIPQKYWGDYSLVPTPDECIEYISLHLYASKLSLWVSPGFDGGADASLMYQISDDEHDVLFDGTSVTEKTLQIVRQKDLSHSLVEMLNLLNFIHNPCCLFIRHRILRGELLWDYNWKYNSLNRKYQTTTETRQWTWQSPTRREHLVGANIKHRISQESSHCTCGTALIDPAGTLGLSYSNENRFKLLASI